MRRNARELALQILFQNEFTPQVDMGTFLKVFEHTVSVDAVDYAKELIEGVSHNKSQIDQYIQNNSAHWKLDRMATVDRNILRIAVFEMKFSKESLKENIAINEAIEISKKFGSSDSASFINGVLDQIAKVS